MMNMNLSTLRLKWDYQSNISNDQTLRHSRVLHEISYLPAELFSPHHQLVTKDGDLLSAHGYTHFSASCYLTRNANFKNKLTASASNRFSIRSTSDPASATATMQITLKTLQQQTIQIEIDPEQTVSGY